MENGKQTHHSMPLVSRLDHLEFIMKNLEGKRNMAKWDKNNNVQGVERPYVPLNLAVREAYFKGSLLDRVASLENRLFQLCLEMESSSSTRCNSTLTSGDASSSQESKRELSYSLPTFNNPYQPHKQEPQVSLSNSEIQGKSSKVQQRRKQLASSVKQHGKNKPSKDEKARKNGKNRVPRNWPHFKLLGC